MEKSYPKRKHPRLPHFDYSTAGVYFITICTQNRRCLLSEVVGRGLAPAGLSLTEYGKIAEEQLHLIPKRYPYVRIDHYVIMPNHIHVLLCLTGETAGESPRPTLTDIVCAYKSLTTRACKKHMPIDKLFQVSFYEHVVRNETDYGEIARYIQGNPARWHEDTLYTAEPE